MVENAFCFCHDKAAFSVKADVSGDCKRARAHLLCLLHRVPKKNCSVAFALEVWRNADWPERHNRKRFAVVQSDFCPCEHHVSDQNAVFFHYNVEFRHKVASGAEAVQHKMLVAAGLVDVPERLARKVFDRPVVRRRLVPERDFFHVDFAVHFCLASKVFRMI